MAPLTRAHARAAAEEAVVMLDPADLGSDLLSHILSFLPADALLAAGAVCRMWREAASRPQLWQPLCEAAWQSKVYVAPAGQPGLSWKQRYLAAQADEPRTAITEQELTTFMWRFRFKAEAGEFWCTLDPYHTSGGRQWLRRVFFPDGRTLPAGELSMWAPLWQAVGHHVFTWRITKSRLGRPGTFVKIHNFPSMIPTRLPDGGWRLENEWVVQEAVLPPGGPYSRGLWGSPAPFQTGEAESSERLREARFGLEGLGLDDLELDEEFFEG